MREWLRRRAIRRAEDKLADLEHELSRWGFAMTPSRKRKTRDDIAKAEAKLYRIRYSSGATT